MSLTLPVFTWDALAPLAAEARRHPAGVIDLSMGSPVDPTPQFIRDAATAATDAHAYPLTAGSPALRSAIVDWFARRRGVDNLTESAVLPTIGSKEFIAGLPLWLGLGAGDIVVQPVVAYPTYAIGAALVGATVVSADDPATWPEGTKLIWINSPGNPDGRVLSVPELRAAVARARELGAIIAGDECYAELAWREHEQNRGTPSILDPRVLEGDHSSVLAVYSLSKQSNLAGYRAGFIAGCPDTVAQLLAIRKHLGLLPPAPIQAAMCAALGDDEHVAVQRERYRARREMLREAVLAAGFRIDFSEAGLYLWVTKGEDAWTTASDLAKLGILSVPGSVYGEAGRSHVRLAITASDEQIARAAARLCETSNESQDSLR